MARGYFQGEVVEIELSKDGKWANVSLGQEAYTRPALVYGAVDSLSPLPEVGDHVVFEGVALAKKSKAGNAYLTVRAESWQQAAAVAQ